MKNRLQSASAILCASIAFCMHAQAATITKAASGSNLNDPASWIGSPPTPADIATWNPQSAGNSLTLNAPASWLGLSATAAQTDISISGSGTLTLGNAGINLANSLVNLSINHPIHLADDQTWQVTAGKSLTIQGAISGTHALTLGAVAPEAIYPAYLTTTPTRIFENRSLADVTITGGAIGGAYVAGGNGTHLASQGYRLNNNGTTATYQLRVIDDIYTKAVKVELTQSGADITGRVLYAK